MLGTILNTRGTAGSVFSWCLQPSYPRTPVWPSETLRHMLVADDVFLLGPQLMRGRVA